MSDLICVAVIAGAFGVQGEVRVKSLPHRLMRLPTMALSAMRMATITMI